MTRSRRRNMTMDAADTSDEEISRANTVSANTVNVNAVNAAPEDERQTNTETTATVAA